MKFGPFVFDAANGTLARNGETIALGHRAVALLAVLLARRGEIVGKEALLDAAWPGQAVEESNLTVQIAALRKALGTTADGQDWIATVPRVGYRFRADPGVETEAPRSTPISSSSIAVLPFANLSSDPEQDYFAEGIAEDLITGLSKVRGLTVIARNSSFAYKTRDADVREVSRLLGVRYIIEGSVRRAGNRLRVSAQLIDGETNSHLWADRYDRELADVFAIQDELVEMIIAALAVSLPAIGGSGPRVSTPDFAAYDLFLRARMLVTQVPNDVTGAVPLLEQAIARDARFAEAHAWLAICLSFGRDYVGGPLPSDRPLARVHAERAISLDSRNADALWALGYVRAHDGMLEEGIAGFEAALLVNPNQADALALFGEVLVYDGRNEDAIDCLKRAFRLNPYPPGYYTWLLGFSLYAAHRYEEALEGMAHNLPDNAVWMRIAAAALLRLGRVSEAKSAAARYIAAHPSFTVSHWGSTQPFRDPADRAHFAEAFLELGLPP